MKITKAEFVASSGRVADKPRPALHEFAFIGRSNVGKSSLINCLCGNSSLAHTSSTPGKTQCINHFLVNDSWYIVDLPGYGFAKVPNKIREQIKTMIADYVDNSQEMAVLFVLLDSRHDIQKIDLQFMLELGEKGVPFAIIFTKSDKSGTNALAEQIEKNKATLAGYWDPLPPVFITSSANGNGRQEVIDYIGETLEMLNQNN